MIAYCIELVGTTLFFSAAHLVAILTQSMSECGVHGYIERRPQCAELCFFFFFQFIVFGFVRRLRLSPHQQVVLSDDYVTLMPLAHKRPWFPTISFSVLIYFLRY